MMSGWGGKFSFFDSAFGNNVNKRNGPMDDEVASTSNTSNKRAKSNSSTSTRSVSSSSFTTQSSKRRKKAPSVARTEKDDNEQVRFDLFMS